MSSAESEDLFGENEPDGSDVELGTGPVVAQAEPLDGEDDRMNGSGGLVEGIKGNGVARGTEVNEEDADGEEDDKEETQRTALSRTHASPVPPEPPDIHSSSPRAHLRIPTRSSLFPCILNPSQPNYSLALDPVSIINLATPCHVLASTPCLTYLLAGCQDGHVRVYDFWSSVQGKAVMTTAQKQTANLGDAVVKGGVSKGWWRNEVEVEVLESEADAVGEGPDVGGGGRKTSSKNAGNMTESTTNASRSGFDDFKKRKEANSDRARPSSAFGFLPAPTSKVNNPFGLSGTVSNGGVDLGGSGAIAPVVLQKKVRIRRLEPVYGMAVHSEGLWAVHGSTSGLINLTTLRHSPGRTIHTLGGTSPSDHSGAISTISLLPGERGMITGSWDKTVKEWDLDTGKVVRTYTPHDAEISAVQMRPFVAVKSVGEGGLTVSISGEMVGKAGDEVAQGAEVGNVAESKLDTDVDMAEGEQAGPASSTKDETKQDTSAEPEAKGSPAESEEGSLFAYDEDDDEQDAAGEPDDDVSMAIEKIATPEEQEEIPAIPPPAPSVAANTPSRKRRLGALSFVPRASSSSLPTLTPGSYNDYSSEVVLVASIDGEVALHDGRIGRSKVGRLVSGDRTPPWCMSACFSSDGNQVIAGRQNATLDVWDVRRMGGSGAPSGSGAPALLKNLRNPVAAKEISAVAAFPDGRHIACAGNDCVRLWNTHDLWDPESSMKKSKSTVPFRIVAGHHGGMISQILIDSTGRFMLTASGNRGWQGDTTRVILAHELKT